MVPGGHIMMHRISSLKMEFIFRDLDTHMVLEHTVKNAIQYKCSTVVLYVDGLDG